MAYCAQDSLAARLRRTGALPWEEAVGIGIKLAGALETAHRCGILHRDVKPGNVLVSDYGDPQLTDFGIAHIAGGFETASGMFTGSLAYTAPEVIHGAPASAASDTYALAATLFQLIAGRPPFESQPDEELAALLLRMHAATAGPAPCRAHRRLRGDRGRDGAGSARPLRQQFREACVRCSLLRPDPAQRADATLQRKTAVAELGMPSFASISRRASAP